MCQKGGFWQAAIASSDFPPLASTSRTRLMISAAWAPVSFFLPRVRYSRIELYVPQTASKANAAYTM